MKTKQFESREEWLEFRKGKIMGSVLGDIIVKRGTGKKIGFYKLIADRIASPATEENPMERGTRLEPEAVEKFRQVTGKKVNDDLIVWVSDQNPNIAISPDGVISDTEALEIKCLSSDKHIKAFIEKKIPDDYEEQAIQYFIVNEKLEKLYFAFYDPRLIARQFFFLEINREDIQEQIDTYLAYQLETLEEVERLVTELTF